ncbi:hypothetical protein TH63_02755 [Rufibacter radiotolerans]|uniref:Gfo/Idh/MocA-like oxidoreductase N-terminal domain-containing protein n=1 Tax=Rufibacter radiotolerans TaxID=1379910 RepID=A0A0H4VHJ7_9BACT|nr:Gfo/Idh/MocA family oxidoreductase [Rufibacter radiotolerans]AKQ44788.1 hypothetical protein TH63_02755 [Rufibacter radiotolerans]
MQINALLIGCGNIGAGYDLDTPERVWTHAKAFSLDKRVKLCIYDQDTENATRIASIYRANHLQSLSEITFSDFDIISITTPTPTHFSYLKQLLEQEVPVIICEKPVVNSLSQIEELMGLYKNSRSKVLVNYIRRFQPAFIEARNKIRQFTDNGLFKGLIIKYNRGFLNNASHAFDLLEFLFGVPVTFSSFYSASAVYDAFEYDPTITGTCTYLNQALNFVGLTGTQYPIFELEIFFDKYKLTISNSGNEIRYYYLREGKLQENREERQVNILDTYMVPVLEEAIRLQYRKKSEDNFLSSLQLNKRILEIIEP